jgi:Flp pilus assembly protein TadD
MATTITTPTTQTKVPSALSELVEAGTTALDDGDLRLALDNFEEVVAAFPDRAEGHNNLGALYSSIGDFEKAEECFDRVITILPDNPNILYNRGVVRSRLEKFDLAREDFNAVLAITPHDADTMNNLGVASFMQGRMDDARSIFSRTMALKPGYVNALLNQVDVECTTDNHAMAISLCEDFLAQHNSPEVRRKHLELLSSGCRKALTEASTAAERILNSDAQNDEVREELGRIIQAKSAWSGAATSTI